MFSVFTCANALLYSPSLNKVHNHTHKYTVSNKSNTYIEIFMFHESSSDHLLTKEPKDFGVELCVTILKTAPGETKQKMDRAP